MKLFIQERESRKCEMTDFFWMGRIQRPHPHTLVAPQHLPNWPLICLLCILFPVFLGEFFNHSPFWLV